MAIARPRDSARTGGEHGDDLFGRVASDAMAFPVSDAIDGERLQAIRAARAQARERAWRTSGRDRARRRLHAGDGPLGQGGRGPDTGSPSRASCWRSCSPSPGWPRPSACSPSRRRPPTDDGDTGLPASIEAAWGLRRRPRKGPKPGLSLERIVEAAGKVAASDGLAAVSMSRVARGVGTSAMSLYRYVAATDELLALMVDAALGAPPAAPGADEGWRAGLSRWAWGYLAVLRRHPWALRIPISGPPTTPNATAWLENALASLRGTGLSEGEKLSVILLPSARPRSTRRPGPA